MLIKEVFDQFLSEQKSKLAPKTYRDYESVIDLFENQLDGYAWNGIDDGEKAYDEAKKQKKSFIDLYDHTHIEDNVGEFLDYFVPRKVMSGDEFILKTRLLRLTEPSAGSRDLFCNRFKMLNILAREVGADTPDEFCFAQEPIRFGDCPLGVDPLWLDSIQPWALDRQLAEQDSHATLTLGLPVMGANPRADFLADVPTGVVPHQQQRLLAVGLQQRADPSEEGGRHRAHGTTVNEANQHLLRVSSKDPVTGDGLRVCVLFRKGHLSQSNRLVIGPRMQIGLRQTRPPDFIGEAQYSFRMGRCQADQPVALLFFNAYRGSGLVIHYLAHFHATPIRLKARRIDSLLKAREVMPCSKQTSASRRSVHRHWCACHTNEDFRARSPEAVRVWLRRARVRHFWGETIWLASTSSCRPVCTNRVAHALCRTSKVRRDLGRTLATSAGKQDLAAS